MRSHCHHLILGSSFVTKDSSSPSQCDGALREDAAADGSSRSSSSGAKRSEGRASSTEWTSLVRRRGSPMSPKSASEPMPTPSPTKTRRTPEGEEVAAGRVESAMASKGAASAGPSIFPMPSVNATMPLRTPERLGSRAHSTLLIETRDVPPRSIADDWTAYTAAAAAACQYCL